MPVRDILRNNVKDKFARGEVVTSLTARLVRGIDIARTAGFGKAKQVREITL